jgi:CheY-like chemotaxis protein
MEEWFGLPPHLRKALLSALRWVIMTESAIDILLVDDNSSDAELTMYALRKANFGNKLKLVRDGAEALDFLFGEGIYARADHRSTVPKVVLLDLKLPKIDGTEVLRRIKSDPRTRNIPVVVLTSSDEERDVGHAYELGANSYIVKPVDFKQLSENIAQVGFYWLQLNHSPKSR